jgi:hypothetical protein
MTQESQDRQDAVFEKAKKSIEHELDPRLRGWNYNTMIIALKKAMGWDTAASKRAVLRPFCRQVLGIRNDGYLNVQNWINGWSTMPAEDVILILRKMNHLMKTERDVVTKVTEEEYFEKAKHSISSELSPEMLSWSVEETKREFRKVMEKVVPAEKQKNCLRYFVNNIMLIGGSEGELMRQTYSDWLQNKSSLETDEIVGLFRALNIAHGKKTESPPFAESKAKTEPPKQEVKEERSKQSHDLREIQRNMFSFGLTSMNQILTMWKNSGVSTAMNEGEKNEVRRVFSNICKSCGIEAQFPVDESQYAPVPRGGLAACVQQTSKQENNS